MFSIPLSAQANMTPIQLFFEQLDESGDGVIDSEELKKGLEHLQVC